mmetsp:Transcript_11109/g.20197  ORF Transcript_11109/g.20197 Transcript_11109/m.20197 type:complete len:545 (-) Transcript_11109:132-1766(-)
MVLFGAAARLAEVLGVSSSSRSGDTSPKANLLDTEAEEQFVVRNTFIDYAPTKVDVRKIRSEPAPAVRKELSVPDSEVSDIPEESVQEEEEDADVEPQGLEVSKMNSRDERPEVQKVNSRERRLKHPDELNIKGGAGENISPRLRRLAPKSLTCVTEETFETLSPGLSPYAGSAWPDTPDARFEVHKTNSMHAEWKALKEGSASASKSQTQEGVRFAAPAVAPSAGGSLPVAHTNTSPPAPSSGLGGLPVMKAQSVAPVSLRMAQAPIVVLLQPQPQATGMTQQQPQPQPAHAAAPAIPASQEPPLPKATAIAELQEALQTLECSRLFRYPPGAQVLQWSHTERRALGGQAMFRAVVAFLRDGVGHHVAGAWQRSKKHSRQDAADVFLQLMRRDWARQAPAGSAAPAIYVDVGALLHAHRSTTLATDNSLQALSQACAERAELRLSVGAPRTDPVWAWQTTGPSWRALVELPLWGVAHTFSGPVCISPDVARAETAQRVLWYLGGYAPCEGLYVPDSQGLLGAECRVAPPPKSWADLVGVDIEG